MCGGVLHEAIGFSAGHWMATGYAFLKNLNRILKHHRVGLSPTSQRCAINISRHYDYKCIKTVGYVYLVYHLENNEIS